ncbi:unnamed protein product [Meganyctiphanes norvegica]|uniref:Translation factor GUF1 homolog, mitochondrial n=1 Tax=Meganyctiphanes norvegica TaxID=48144 RepID=A0AAV2QM88_MEGNR
MINIIVRFFVYDHIWKPLLQLCSRRYLVAYSRRTEISRDIARRLTVREGIPEMGAFPQSRIRNRYHSRMCKQNFLIDEKIISLIGEISKKNKQTRGIIHLECHKNVYGRRQAILLSFTYNSHHRYRELTAARGRASYTPENTTKLKTNKNPIHSPGANIQVQSSATLDFNLVNVVIATVLPRISIKNLNNNHIQSHLLAMVTMATAAAFQISAKKGTGVTNLIEKIIDAVPSPLEKCNKSAPLRALLFDSWFDKYKGAVCMIWIVDGTIKKGDYITSAHTGKVYEVKNLGILTPEELSVKELYTGQVGFFTANIRSTKEAQLGDTFFHRGNVTEPLAEITPAKPMVFAGVYPVDQSEYHALHSAIERLTLNDASVSVTPESSSALGQGWRLGFLGLLHMDVFSQRLDLEHGAHVVFTTPSVPYKVRLHGEKVIKKYGSEEVIINNPSNWPEVPNIVETSEPFVLGTIITPDCYLGSILSLCQDRRGIQQSIKNIDESRIIIQYKLPLNEVVVDFYDKLKSCSSGYATFDYEDLGYEESSLVKLNILLNGNLIEELSSIVHYSRARQFGKNVCLKLCDTIPKQLFQIGVQAAVGGKVLARENIKAMRKDVLAKCVMMNSCMNLLNINA